MTTAVARKLSDGFGIEPAIAKPRMLPTSVLAPRTPDTTPQLRRGTDSGSST